MKMTFRTVAIATSTVAFAALFSPGWSEQGGLSLSIKKAEALTRVYVTSPYAATGGYARNDGSWYAVRAYYWGGPWSGPGYSYAAGMTMRRATALVAGRAAWSRAGTA